eukprot:c20979_g1_i1 orf=201-2039(+)
MNGDSGTAKRESCFSDTVLPDLTANKSSNTNDNSKPCLEPALGNGFAESMGIGGHVGLVARKSCVVGGNDKNLEDENGPSIVLQCTKEDLAMEDTHSLKTGDHDLEELKSMYEHEGDWDNDEEDKDWDPDENVELLVRWFCTNCTDSNPDEEFCCKQCGEHRVSGILKTGFLAPMCLPIMVDDTVPRRNSPGAGASNDKLAVISPPCLTPQTDTASTAIGFDERMLLHSEVQLKSHPHPERPDRLRAIMAGLSAAGLLSGRCCTIPSREATIAEMESVHSRLHVDAVEATSSQESSFFGRDTYANSHSALAARLAAGICVDLATAIVNGQVLNGFALVRPPGHHAMHATAMGFCLHNNAALAAKAALTAGAKKVLIVDWDVHHGNGTQEIFDYDSSVLYVSLHRHQGGLFYPGTGAATEVGFDSGEGYSVNIPWPCGGIGDEDYLFAFQNIVLPIAVQFAPDITIISAGFDAAKGDPLGGCQVTPPGYAHMTQMLYSLMKGRLLVVLEGGYNLRSISASAAAVLKVLLGEPPDDVPTNCQPTIAGLAAVLEASHVQARYWKIDAMSIIKMRLQLAAAEAKLKEDDQQPASSSYAEESQPVSESKVEGASITK